MLTNRLVLSVLLKKRITLNCTSVAPSSTISYFDERAVIGKREWVGYGVNGRPTYVDNLDYPAPAVRFKEITGDLIPLREKEKGDWKNLSIEEKKKLYRASFRQTLVEAYAPTGEWKLISGLFFIGLSLVAWIVLFMETYVYRPKPHTFSEEHRAAALRRIIDLKLDPISGISSKWDYEKDDWKK